MSNEYLPEENLLVILMLIAYPFLVLWVTYMGCMTHKKVFDGINVNRWCFRGVFSGNRFAYAKNTKISKKNHLRLDGRSSIGRRVL